MLRGILFAPAIGLALLTLEMRRSWGITDPRVLGGFVVSALLLAYWVRHQAAQAVPLIDVRMLAKPGIALPNIAMIFLGLGAIQLGQTLSLLLPQPSWTGIGLGLAATAVGWFMLPLNSMTIVVGPLAGRISRRIGAHGVALIGASGCLIAWLMMVQWHGSLGQVIAAAVICTMGYGMLMPSIFNLIAEASPVERASEAAGVNQVCLVAFMAVGSQLLFGLLGSDKVSDAAHGAVAFPSATAFGSVFVYLASMSACCLVVLLVIAGRRHITAFGKLGTVQEKQA